MKDTAILDSIRNYYGKALNSNRDLKTGACCAIDTFSADLRRLHDDVHPEIFDCAPPNTSSNPATGAACC